eukprot:1412516-Amphidinium_carterae.1
MEPSGVVEGAQFSKAYKSKRMPRSCSEVGPVACSSPSSPRQARRECPVRQSNVPLGVWRGCGCRGGKLQAALSRDTAEEPADEKSNEASEVKEGCCELVRGSRLSAFA